MQAITIDFEFHYNKIRPRYSEIHVIRKIVIWRDNERTYFHDDINCPSTCLFVIISKHKHFNYLIFPPLQMALIIVKRFE